MKKIINLILVLIGVLLVSNSAFAQQETQADTTQVPPPPKKDKEPFWDRVFLGGNFGLQFGDITVVNISPSLGYRVTEKFHVGVGATYIYLRANYFDPFSNTNNVYQTNIYGGSVFSKYFLLENIFAYTELQVINLEVVNDITYKLERKNLINPFIGGGYQQEIGDNSGLFILILFNLNETSDSPHSNPEIRVGFSVGL